MAIDSAALRVYLGLRPILGAEPARLHSAVRGGKEKEKVSVDRDWFAASIASQRSRRQCMDITSEPN